MRPLLIFILLLSSLDSYNQTVETKKVSSAYFKEFYSVDKSTGLSVGPYVRLDKQKKDTLVYGIYQDGQRCGVWKYFGDENALWVAYDFSKKSLVYVSEEINKVDSFMVKKGNSYVNLEVDNPPIYLSSKNEIEAIFLSRIKLAAEITANTKSGISIARFVVSKEGKIKEITSDLMLSGDLFPQIKEILETLEGEWIPAKANGEAIDAQYMLVLDIKPGGKPLFADNPKCIVVHFNYSNLLNTKRVVGYELRRVDAKDMIDSNIKVSRSRRMF